MMSAKPFPATEDEQKFEAILRSYLDLGDRNIDRTDSLIDDLGADSLDMIEIVMDVEDQFNVAINDNHIESAKTVADAVRVIEEALKEKS